MKEVNVDIWFDEEFEAIDKSEHLKGEDIGTTTKQILEAYEESREELNY